MTTEATKKAPEVKTEALAAKEPTLREFLERNKHAVAGVAAAHLNADRIVKLAALVVHRDKSGALAKCSPLSILGAVMEASRLGLEVGGALGQAYLVPYGKEATFIVGYRGLIALALRSQAVTSIVAHPVHERDVFRYTHGDDAKIVHEPPPAFFWSVM